ncbi:zinc finger CCCH domain-containing protein 10-like isoform X2 [Physella acuta]|uniref:zinc finger CCCH domain-containing protein 10-like isoform X2 n=1 Tax=Physella acuta TaxID=109671 RepID=UPI0027DD6B33|nr:zinc finger CCCH domain-containing protein 10-like isoform X2 [Physella acuta]XP_059154077.1 zinc finger CCCH domain-containing protein 10-like isoform X2 [Physella acuta]XP_059154078.1 zinc finger CCCH domain-containing protein 10-like isoform X2 [Physella acuta]XP_059154079.1 zinc finger CCCH domain-containing protein 10-like isoform X2 [Physella acuta]
MSNKSDSGSESPINGSSGRLLNGEQYDDDICRDYMRNVCTRGKRCRYRHPALDDRPDPPPRRDLTFCHDYQNNGCTRPNCKFLHCSRDEEEYFHRTGLLPSRLNYSNTVGAHLALKAEVPVCRDYFNGDCKRGSKCKYRHDADKCAIVEYDRRHDRHYDYIPDLKRRRMDDEYESIRAGISFSLLEDENAMLKRKIEELKKQVCDLTAINEVLLDQNARYRVSKAAAALVSSNQSLPTLALGPAVTPAHAQASINQMNSTLTQQVALNSDLATQHALAAQRMAAAAGGGLAQSRAQPAMAVTPTVTLTQNVAGALALTQSNIAVSMASMPQLQVAHSLTQSLGAPSTSLVSYPIMSHSMRTAVEPSSH